MKISSRFLSIVSCLVLFLSCGGEETSESEAASEASSDERALVSALAIGVEMGDSCYVFGDIGDACIDQDGSIHVMDIISNTITSYGQDGTYIGRTGGQGEGPGEYGRPAGMIVLEDGRIAVSDVMLNRVTYLDGDQSVDETVEGFVPWPPSRIRAASEASYTGSNRVFHREDSRYGHMVALWNESPEPVIEYYRKMGDFNMENLRESTQANQIVFTSDMEGRVYIAPLSSTEFGIDVFDSTGVQLYSIDEEREPADRPESDLQEEREEMREQLQREGAPPMEWDPNPRYPMIPLGGMGIDGEGRLWVRDGRSVIPRFSVYSGDEHVFDAVLEDATVPGEGLRVKVTPGGILAWQGDPETYPRIFLLELQQH